MTTHHSRRSFLKALAFGAGSLAILPPSDTFNARSPLFVIGIAGQSNAVGYGTHNQAAPVTSLLFGNDGQIKALTDPTDSAAGQLDGVSNDGANAKGSPWPLLAGLVVAHTNRPVMIVPCAKGGSGIGAWQPGADHEDRTTLYGSMARRLLITGCNVVLWHQGENDTGMAQATYNAYLDTLADALYADTGAKLMPAKLENLTAWAQYPGTSNANVNGAIGEAWADNAHVLTGPDFSDLTPSSTGVHFATDAEMTTLAGRWWDALRAAPVLGESATRRVYLPWFQARNEVAQNV